MEKKIIESGVIHDLMVDKNFRNNGGGLKAYPAWN